MIVVWWFLLTGVNAFVWMNIERACLGRYLPLKERWTTIFEAICGGAITIWALGFHT